MADNYEKIKLIGNGSYGKVYLATNIKSNTSQRYVIKVTLFIIYKQIYIYIYKFIIIMIYNIIIQIICYNN